MFPRMRTTAITPNERHHLKNLQIAIKSVRREYYNENIKNFNKAYASYLTIQMLVNFMRSQWVKYEN